MLCPENEYSRVREVSWFRRPGMASSTTRRRGKRKLLPVILALAAVLCPLFSQNGAIPLTVEKIYAHGPLIGNLPNAITWSPDGKHLTYLDGGELIDLDPASGRSE